VSADNGVVHVIDKVLVPHFMILWGSILEREYLEMRACNDACASTASPSAGSKGSTCPGPHRPTAAVAHQGGLLPSIR